jgi:hypothetical protein
MPNLDENVIFKLSIDGDGYIRGCDALTASTAKFTEEQARANNTLKTNEAALKINTDRLNRAKADLEAYTGTNARYRKQLEGDVKSAEKDQAQLTELVNKNRIAYEQATKAASDFADTAARAANVQQQAGGGKIPAPTVVQPVIPQVGAGIQEALKGISLGDLPETLSKTLPEFEALRAVISDAKARMGELNQEDEEFKQLAPIVAQGEEALAIYDKQLQKTVGHHMSLREEILNTNNELARLEQAGKGASQEYADLEKHAAHLTELYREQRERIRVLSSETRLLDFGKAAIETATAGFEAFTSVQLLFGDATEETQKKVIQLFAAMQLLTALERISEQVKRGGVIATNLQTAAQATYTAVVGASTGALKAFRLALLGTGILAAVAAIGYLVVKYQQMKKATEEAGKANKELNEIRNKAIDSYAKEVSQLEILRRKLSDQQIPLNERIRLAKEYNTTAEESARIDLKQITNIDLLNAAIDRQIEKIKERALAQAAANAAEQKAAVLLKAQEKVIEIAPKFNLNIPDIDRQIKNVQDQLDDLSFKEFTKENIALTKHLQELRAALLDVKSANNDFNRSAKLAATIAPPQTCPPGYHWDASKQQCVKNETKEPNAPKLPDNVYEEERQKQKERLSELLRKSVEDEKTIRAQYEEQLKAEILRISNLLKDKKLTKPQAENLKIEAGKINTVGLDKALEDYRKKVADAREKINKETRDLQQKAIGDSLGLLHDEFDKRAALISFNEQKELGNEKESTDERLRQLNLDRLLLGEEAYQKARAEIITVGEQNANNITQKYAVERQQLSIDIFNEGLNRFNNILELSNLQLDESLSKQISSLSQRFLSGKITYEKYQRDITNIQKKYEQERRQSTLDTEREELRALENQIAGQAGNKNLTEKQATELVKKRDELRSKIAKDQADIDQGAAGEDNTLAKQRADQVTEYANAIGQLTDSVIQFWQKANEAEQKALDRSIALQEKRVEAAQRIAERGNAQYLKEEQDRLDEMNVKRENAARRQLGIDAALQASQILVGITGAIAKISTGIGAAETIAEIAVIVGALATGYGLVKSLQGNQPRLFVGTTDTGPGKNVDDKGGFHAILHPHEAVIPADKNKKYKPTIEAIYHGKISPEVINNFVQNRNKTFTQTHIDSIPRLDTEKIKHTAETKISHDSRLASMVSEQNKLLRENNDYQRQLLRKTINVQNTIDENGVATIVTEFIENRERDKKL